MGFSYSMFMIAMTFIGYNSDQPASVIWYMMFFIIGCMWPVIKYSGMSDGRVLELP